MCGIAGIVSSDMTDVCSNIVLDMVSSISHRGPDENKIVLRKNFCFGTARLAIVDVENGSQPYSDPAGNTIAFNGEIYNHKELRMELIERGHFFDTHSDTEVVLKGYVEYGNAIFQKLDGMFALAIFDVVRNKVILARDRFGVKPLYFHQNTRRGELIFSSEIRALLKSKKFESNINTQAVSHFLTFRFVPSNVCIWDQVKKVLPGQIIIFDLEKKKLQETNFGETSFHGRNYEVGRNYQDEFSKLFLSSVKKRIETSEVGFGILLSGGLDSSAICVAARELGYSGFDTFCVGFENEIDADETLFAKSVSSELQTKHHEIKINQRQFLDLLPKIADVMEEPYADLSAVPLFYLTKEIQQHQKMVLSGEGADEVLGGYNFQKIKALFDILKLIETALPHKMFYPLFRNGNRDRRLNLLKSWTENGAKNMLRGSQYFMSMDWNEDDKSGYFNECGLQSSEDYLDEKYSLLTSDDALDQIQGLYSGDWLTEDLLMKSDKVAMANSVEVREPFLDIELAKWCGGAPSKIKVGSISGGYNSKVILRQFCSSHLPNQILRRKKQGFPVPAYKWMSGNLNGWAHDLIFASSSGVKNMINKKKLEHCFSGSLKGDAVCSRKIWNLVMLEFWMQRWQQN